MCPLQGSLNDRLCVKGIGECVHSMSVSMTGCVLKVLVNVSTPCQSQ